MQRKLGHDPSLTCSYGSTLHRRCLGAQAGWLETKSGTRVVTRIPNLTSTQGKGGRCLSKCQLIMATGDTVAQDLTMPWSTLSGFMQDLSLMVIDEGQPNGTDREIATISLRLLMPRGRASRGSSRQRWIPRSSKALPSTSNPSRLDATTC